MLRHVQPEHAVTCYKICVSTYKYMLKTAAFQAFCVKLYKLYVWLARPIDLCVVQRAPHHVKFLLTRRCLFISSILFI